MHSRESNPPNSPKAQDAKAGSKAPQPRPVAGATAHRRRFRHPMRTHEAAPSHASRMSLLPIAGS